MKSKLLVLVIIILSVHACFSQEFAWKQNDVIKNNFYQYVIGKTDKFIYLFFSAFPLKVEDCVSLSDIQFKKLSLVKYDTDSFNLVSSEPFEFKKTPVFFYTAYINEEGIHFLYSSYENDQYILNIDNYTLDFTYKETFSFLNFKKKADAIWNDKIFNYVYSENKNFLTLYTENDILLLNKSMQVIWHKQIKNTKYKTVLLTNDGSFYAVEIKDNFAKLLQFDLSGQIITKSINYPETILADMKLKWNERDQEVVVAATYGISLEDVPENKLNSFYFRTQGLFLTSFDPVVLKEKSTIKIPLSGEVVIAITGKNNPVKLKGVEDLWIFDLFFPPKGSIVALLQMHNRIYRDMILMKIDTNGSSIQKDLQRAYVGDYIYEYMLSSAAFYEKEKLYILYNEGSIRYKLKVVTYDSNLELLSKKEILTYQEHKIYLAVRHHFKIAENKYFIYGRERKFSGGTVLTFK